jgi:hypothetical protein
MELGFKNTKFIKTNEFEFPLSKFMTIPFEIHEISVDLPATDNASKKSVHR